MEFFLHPGSVPFPLRGCFAIDRESKSHPTATNANRYIFHQAPRPGSGLNPAKERVFMSRLTEQEQQEIIRFIEADRPLPDKYRFLLFAATREVGMVWNGKTSEVCNIVLPFQVIEQGDEPRAERPEDTSSHLKTIFRQRRN